MKISIRTKSNKQTLTPGQVAFAAKCVEDYMLRRHRGSEKYSQVLHGENNCCEIKVRKGQIVARVYFKKIDKRV